MRKRYRDFKSQDENVFAVSTGDLMASLLFIFILLLAGALLQVQEKSEQDERIAGAYNEIKEKIYEALKAEFSLRSSGNGMRGLTGTRLPSSSRSPGLRSKRESTKLSQDSRRCLMTSSPGT